MSNRQPELSREIEAAEKLHGHLGPFLVIGVRAGILAKKILNVKENSVAQVIAQLPLYTPFSCILDGIQSTTQCTIGNQRLRAENSEANILLQFKWQDSVRSIRVQVNPKIVEELQKEFWNKTTNKELAWKIASMPETNLFSIDER
ncbi:hypothetical protein GTO27_01760 [Candidatus Bathyarchaeota archaeon]|nr:hypothetical protein [Candidatus Bathyarchaeota archaeon]